MNPILKWALYIGGGLLAIGVIAGAFFIGRGGQPAPPPTPPYVAPTETPIPAPPTQTLPPPPPATNAPPPALTPIPVPPTSAPPTVSASSPVAFYDQLFLWKNGARHSDLPTGPNGPDVSWLVHGDIGYDHTCNWVVLENTAQIASLYPGTYRVVGIQGGILADRVAFATDRVINIGQPCTAR